MRRHRIVMIDRTETITQEGGATARKISSELSFVLYTYCQSWCLLKNKTMNQTWDFLLFPLFFVPFTLNSSLCLILLSFEQMFNVHYIDFVWWLSTLNMSMSYQTHVVHTLHQPELCLAVSHSCPQPYNWERRWNDKNGKWRELRTCVYTLIFCFILFFLYCVPHQPTSLYHWSDLWWWRRNKDRWRRKSTIFSLSFNLLSIIIVTDPAGSASWCLVQGSRGSGESLVITAG